MMYDYQVAAIK